MEYLVFILQSNRTSSCGDKEWELRIEICILLGLVLKSKLASKHTTTVFIGHATPEFKWSSSY